MLNLFSHWIFPFSKAVLNRRELGKLALPVGKESESFGVAILEPVSLGRSLEYVGSAYMIKFAVIAADKLAEIQIEFREHPLPRVVPEPRIFTLFLTRILEGKIQVRKVRFPRHIVLFLFEGRGLVCESIEGDQVSHTIFLSENMLLRHFQL
jgi:hypothetical protein